MKNLRASEFMEKDPATANAEMPLCDLVSLLWTERVRALPVTDAIGQLIGVVSETDLFLKNKALPFSLERVPTLLGQPVAKDEITEFEPANRVTVAEIMSKRPVTIGPDTTIEEAAMHMLYRRLSVLPVVEGDRLIGMVRRLNLLRGIYGTSDTPESAPNPAE